MLSRVLRRRLVKVSWIVSLDVAVKSLTMTLAPAQVLLRWAIQRGMAVIPKSNSSDRLVQNLQSEDFELSEDDMKAISGLNINLRVCFHTLSMAQQD